MGDRTKAYALLFGALCQGALFGCGESADPRSTRGCIRYAAAALADDDGERLYRVLDERERHALHSISEDYRASRAAIESDYPEALRTEALARFPDLEPAALFASRCDRACRTELGGRLGAPTAEEMDGDELRVTTTRGKVRLYRPREGAWWGFVWRLDELSAERDRASRDRRQVEQNAATYRRRDVLQAERERARE